MKTWKKCAVGIGVMSVLALAGCGHQAVGGGGADEAEPKAMAEQRAAAAQQAAAAQAAARQAAPQSGQGQPK